MQSRTRPEGSESLHSQRWIAGMQEVLADQKSGLARQGQEKENQMTTTLAIQPQQGQITPLELIQDALRNNVPADVLKELVSLQQSMVRFDWEAQERQAKIDFDNALNKCQSQVQRIKPNVHRENNIWWADYKEIDRNIRPLYIDEGFSIGFSEEDSSDPTRIRMRAAVSRGGISRDYFCNISRTPASSKMGQADADASAASRAKRYLMLQIFNIAVGIDEDEKKGMTNDEGADWVAAIESGGDAVETMESWTKAVAAAKKIEDYKAMTIFTEARDKRLKELKRTK